MKRFERELSIFFFTSVPCFVLASVFFFLVKGEVTFSIIAFAFSLFLVCVSFWLRRESMTKAGSICDKESDNQEKESLDICIKELQRQIYQLKKEIDTHETHIKCLEKRLNQLEAPRIIMAEPPKGGPIVKPESKTKEYYFTCNIKGIEDKNELTSADRFFVMRNGRGVMTLKNFSLLVPNAFELGKEVTPNMHKLWTSYGMGKLFDLSSRDMIHFKIKKIIPAEIQIIGDKNEDIFQGILLKKGKIELEEGI